MKRVWCTALIALRRNRCDAGIGGNSAVHIFSDYLSVGWLGWPSMNETL